jgi:hypothetical protein
VTDGGILFQVIDALRVMAISEPSAIDNFRARPQRESRCSRGPLEDLRDPVIHRVWVSALPRVCSSAGSIEELLDSTSFCARASI